LIGSYWGLIDGTYWVVDGDGLGQAWVLQGKGMGLRAIVTSKEPFFYSMEQF